MKELILLWTIIVFRIWLLLCSIWYVYWLINGKWSITGHKIQNKLRAFLGTGAFITLFLIIYHGIGATFPFIRIAKYYWWEGDILIPIYLPLALVITIWIKRTLDIRYIERYKNNTE